MSTLLVVGGGPHALGQYWQNGDVVTYTESDWGGTPSGNNPAMILLNNFAPLYGETLFEVGIPGASGFSMRFGDATSVLDYLPATGATMGPLTADFINPTLTMAGPFGGTVVTLRLNVDFADAGILPTNRGVPFGDIVIQNISEIPWANGMSVRELLSVLETALGGGPQADTFEILDILGHEVSRGFAQGFVSQVAQDHLRLPASPPPQPDFKTYLQVAWGGQGVAASLLTDHFDAVYPGGVFEVGVPASAGFSAQFTSAQAVLDFLPQSGTPGRLLADYENPLATNAGAFAAETAALKLNVDFADAGLLGQHEVPFGDLVLDGFGSFNGMSVRQVLSLANDYLGSSDVGPDLSPNLSSVARSLNEAFPLGRTNASVRDRLRLPDADFVTYRQLKWGDVLRAWTAEDLLEDHFSTLYPGGVVEIGRPGASGFSIQFTSAQAVQNFLPASGALHGLNSDLVNPLISPAGEFAGNVLALKLNIDLADAGLLGNIIDLGGRDVAFGSLVLHGLDQWPQFNGFFVGEVLSAMNQVLGNGQSGSAFNPLVEQLNLAFDNGWVSDWAQAHLRLPFAEEFGDFNGNGVVDAADYVVWRNGMGTTYHPSDYDLWRANFGRSFLFGGGGAQIAPGSAGGFPHAVPEPGAVVWAAAGMVLLTLRVRFFITRTREENHHAECAQCSHLTP